MTGASAGPLELVKNDGPQIETVGKEVKGDAAKAPTPEELTEKLNALGAEMRALIVLTKKLPANKALGPHQDPVRSIALAQSHLQTGFMWLRRAITQPNEF